MFEFVLVVFPARVKFDDLREVLMNIWWKSMFITRLSVLVLFLLVTVGSSGAVVAGGPMGDVKATVDDILVLLRQEQAVTAWPEQREKIVDNIKDSFAFHELSMRVLGRHWRKRSPSEKEHFVHLFSTILENSYIERLRCYTDEEVVFQKEIIKGNKAIVYSAIIRNQQEIPMVYRVKMINGRWLVYDLIIEGVSLVGNYRKQFAQIIKREKYSGLLDRMKVKANVVEACR